MSNKMEFYGKTGPEITVAVNNSGYINDDCPCGELSTAENLLNIVCRFGSECKDLSDEVWNLKESYIRENHLKYQFNVISAAARGRLRETAHSQILAYMLRHPDIQQSFLNYFFNWDSSELLEVETEFGNEKSHIDVILYDSHKCIIIENKVNGAVEQAHQVYRYVHDIAEEKLNIKRNNIYVVYLNPRNHDNPTFQSITNEHGEDNIMESLGSRFLVKSFAYDIREWLQQIVVEKEPIVESGIKLYIDYLENYFQLTNKYTPMKKEIKKYILDKYEINEETPLENQIEILEQKKENVDFLAEQLSSIIKDIKADRAAQKLNSIYKQIELDFKDLKDVCLCNRTENRPYLNLEVCFSVCDEQIKFQIEYDQNYENIYYGIVCNQKENNESYNKIVKNFKPYVESFTTGRQSATPNWPVWRNTSFENAYMRFKGLIEFAQSLKSQKD